MTYGKDSSGGALDATAVSQKSDWQIVQEVLALKGLSLEEFVYPERHKGQAVTAKRQGAIREMFKRDLTLDQMEILTPFSRRYLLEIKANGNEPELGLDLGEKETQTELDPSGSKDGISL